MVKFSNEFVFTTALAKIIRENLDKSPMEIAHLILVFEDSQGVVIKVEDGILKDHGAWTIEPLIKEAKNDNI